jgi:hypothetical protein
MKTSLLIALAFLLLPFVTPASAAEGSSFPLIRTNSGKVYVNCRVYKTQPDGVIIEFENGGAKLRFADLSPELRAMLNYDPEKEAAYEKERSEKKRKQQEEQEELAKARVEMARVQAAAYEAEAARYQFMAMQGGFGGHGGVGGYPYAGDYGMGYAYDNAAYFPYNGYGVGPGYYGYYGYGGLLNSPYANNYGIQTESITYGNGHGYGIEAFHVDPVTRRGVSIPVPCRTNWNGGNRWNGNGAWHGRSFNGHNAGSRAFCRPSSPHLIGRPHYNIQAPCAVPLATPAFGRFSPGIGSCVRR